MLVQLQIFDDLRAKQREHIRSARKLKPRDDLFCDCGTADQVPLLQHAHLLPSLRTHVAISDRTISTSLRTLCNINWHENVHFCKISGRHESVVSASDHDRIPTRRSSCCVSPIRYESDVTQQQLMAIGNYHLLRASAAVRRMFAACLLFCFVTVSGSV